jgi:protein-S-isoprenylcysteine O-methyltransferase Ste14
MIPMSSDYVSETRRGLSHLQRRRKLVIFGLVLLLLVALPMMQSLEQVDMAAHELIEIGGLFLIGIAILGRGWCTLYIGGNKAQLLTDTGPYSISRNPLYMFSFIGAAGVGAQSGSLVIAGLFALGAFAVFWPVIVREERALADLFGLDFAHYQTRVPRFGPRFSVWKDVETLSVHPRLVWRTLRDGLVFLMVVPIFELIDWLQLHGTIHPLVFLP